jgi:hypothetical protein
MPAVTQGNNFSNAKFTSSDILKFVQENGSKILWREVTGLDWFMKKGEWSGGKQKTYHLTVDAGGLAFGGLNQTAGTFANPDRAYGIQGFMTPKYQTFTMYFDNILNDISKDAQVAYINHMKQEMQQKMTFQKSFMGLQHMGDGTGRFATPIGLGDSAKGAGGTTDNTFTLTGPNVPLKIKFSSADTAVGSSAHFMEGSIVSVMFPGYDEGTTGTANKTKATCIPRLLVLAFDRGNTNGNTRSFFDAFRVVRVNISKNEILVVPARKAAPDVVRAADAWSAYAPYDTPEAGHHVQQGGQSGVWCQSVAGSTVTVTLYRGRDNTLAKPTVVTELQFNSVFNPTALTSATGNEVLATYAVNPNYVPTGIQSWAMQNSDFSSFTNKTYINQSDSYDSARVMLGIGWDPNVDTGADTSAIDVSQVNPYLMTGLESLLFNRTGVVHGINRAAIQQILPSEKDFEAQPLSFTGLFSGLTEHYARNRDKDPNSSSAAQFNILSMQAVTYSHLLSLSEQDRRIIDDKSIRGTACKAITVGTKKYELDMNTAMRTDRIIGLPKGAFKQDGGTIAPVTASGQKEFLSIANNRRVNATESYYTVNGETYCDNLRDCFYARNFTINTL